ALAREPDAALARDPDADLAPEPDPDADFRPDAAVVLLADAVRRFGAGLAARRSASNSIARCSVIDSGMSPLRSDALVSPSVTYGPNRPSRSTTGLPLASSTPSSRSGGAAAALAALPRCLGWANSSLA